MNIYWNLQPDTRPIMHRLSYYSETTVLKLTHNNADHTITVDFTFLYNGYVRQYASVKIPMMQLVQNNGTESEIRVTNAIIDKKRTTSPKWEY